MPRLTLPCRKPRWPLGFAPFWGTSPTLARAEAGSSIDLPGLGLTLLLALAAVLLLVALKRLTKRSTAWMIGALPACLAVGATAALLDSLAHGAAGRPWAYLGLLAGATGLALSWYALAERHQPAAPVPSPDEAPWFARTQVLDLKADSAELDSASTVQSYRAIHDAAAEAIITTDAQGTILSANPATEALFGFRQEELRGHSLTSLVIDLEEIAAGENHPDSPPVSGRPCQATAKRKDGTDFAVELVTSRVVRAEGVAFITLLRDISERQRAEHALRRSNELLRAILEGTQESLFLMDPEGRLLAINPTAAARLGKTAENLLGTLVFELFPPEVRESRRDAFFEVVRSGRTRRIEDRRAGHVFAIHYYPIKGADGTTEAVSVFAQDITERKRAEDELRKSEARYRNLLDNMQVGYLQSDARTGLIRAANPALAKIMGFDSPEALIGQPTTRFYVNPEDRAPMLEAVKRHGVVRNYPIKIRGADGQLVPIEFHIRLLPESEDDPPVLEALAIDVSARLQAEARLREADQQLRDMADELPCVVFQYRSDCAARGHFSFVGGRVRDLDMVGPEAILENPRLLLANILPEDRPAHVDSLKRAAHTLENWASDFRVRGAGDRLRWLHAAAVLHEAPGGEIVWNGYWIDITDRKLAEQALEEGRNLLQGILDGTAETLVLLDREGRILAANTTAAHRVGETPASLKGQDFFAFFPPDVSLARRAVFERAVSTGVAQSMQDGRKGRYFAINFYPIRDAHAQTKSVVLFALDVTEAKQADENLRESERRYREVFEKLQVGYFKLTVGGAIEAVNPRAAQLLGYASPAELCSHHAADIYFDLAVRETLKKELERQGKVANYPMSLRRKDGSELQILANSEFLYDAAGTPTHIETSVQDITELRQLEARLRESEARFRQHLFALPIEICICDVKGRVEYANQQYLATIGYAADEAPHLADWWALAVPDPVYRAEVSQRWREATRAVMGRDTAASMPKVRLSCRDGAERIFDIVARRMGEQYLVVFSNVTVREDAAQALQRAKEAAEHAALARAQFLATMSHEVRTPLNGIVGMTELALATATDAEQKRYLQIARSSADALMGLLNAVLDFSRIEAGRLHAERVEFDLRENVCEVLAVLRPQAERKGLVLRSSVDNRIPHRLVSDPLRLRQILTNLLANAIKFTERGEIYVSIALEERDGARLRLHCQVRDTGIGIPEDRLQAIFSAFVQADGSITRRFGGTGLGLAICSRLAEMLGGQIWAESKVGQGSTFHCIVEVEMAGEAGA